MLMYIMTRINLIVGFDHFSHVNQILIENIIPQCVTFGVVYFPWILLLRLIYSTTKCCIFTTECGISHELS